MLKFKLTNIAKQTLPLPGASHGPEAEAERVKTYLEKRLNFGGGLSTKFEVDGIWYNINHIVLLEEGEVVLHIDDWADEYSFSFQINPEEVN